MAASQIGVFNKALRWLEERPVSQGESISPGTREPVRLLNIEWTDAIQRCLYEGFWKFALRTDKVLPDTAQKPNFGRKYSFTKPADWVRTYQISQDDRFFLLDREFIDENNVWLSDLPYLFIRYVSNDPNRGLNMGLWTPGFTEYLAVYLAYVCCPRIKQALDKKTDLLKEMKRIRIEALATDAMDAPPGKIPPNTWVTSRTPRGSVYPYGAYGWGGD